VKPVTVSVDVPQSRERVWEFLEVLANHERFTDHFLLDWQLSGPPRGVGATASFRVKATGEKDWSELRVIDSEPPRRSVEETIGGSKAKRRTRGTYTLEELPGGGTRITFELATLEMPRGERMMGPLNRAYLKRVNRKAMRRLKERLTTLRD
jgi:hypothetical protein